MAFLAPLRVCDVEGKEVPTTSYDRLPPEPCVMLVAEAPIRLFSQQWTEARYLIFDVAYQAQQHSKLTLRFFAKNETEPRLSIVNGFIPGLPARLVFHFRHLNAETLFLPRTPGRLKATCLGRRIDPSEIGFVEICLEAADHQQWCFITVPRLNTDQPFCKVGKQQLVDELGQLRNRDWPGKMTSVDELRQSLQAERAAPPPSGAQRTGFGGYTDLQFEAAGFFRTHHDGDRWWLVDPDGYAFFSAGLDCVKDSETAAVVPGTEQLYSWIPRKDEEFGDCLSSHTATGTPTVLYGRANLRRSFGDDWRQAWEELTARRMQHWGFNTVGNWSDTGFARRAHFPYVRNLTEYPTTAQKLYRDLPDVFDPLFNQAAQHYAKQLVDTVQDPLLIGYFMANEPKWAFGRANLASEMLEQHPGSHSRRALASFVAATYNDDVDGWRKAWGIQAEGFKDLEERCFHRLADTHPGAAKDLWAFSKILARRFVDIPARECRAIDPNHLNLGLRFAWISSELCYEVSKEFDVFSINSYEMRPDPAILAEIVERCNKPVLIGEFHFGALDRGLLGTGLRGVANQDDRGAAYRAYLETCAADPGCIGCHYFTLNDQAALGRFDGECWQIGFVNVCQQAYPEIGEAARLSHSRMYNVRTGKLPAFDAVPPETVKVAF